MLNSVLNRVRKNIAHISAAARENGQAIVIYAVILAAVAVVSAGTIFAVNNSVNDRMDRAEQRIANISLGSDESFIELERRAHMSVITADYSGVYDMSAHTGSVTVTEPASGFTIRYGITEGAFTQNTAPQYADVGTWTVFFKVSAEGYYDYNGSFDVTITQCSVAIPTAYGSFTYDGSTKSATIENYNSTCCTQRGTASAVNAGTYTLTFALKNTSFMKWSDGTTADKSYSWTIAKCNLNSATIAAVADQDWTGSAITPEPAVSCNGRTLSKGTDFTYSYNNNVTSGTATISVNATASGNYTGYKTTTFNIIARNMTVSASGYSGTYDGTAHTGTVTVTAPASGATVYYGTSATSCTSVSPIYRTKAGTQTVYFKVTANNYADYTGSFTISISRATITTVPSTAASWWYTGSTVTPTWSNYDAAKMTRGGTASAVSIGTYTATFTPTANYTWSDGSTAAKSVSWKIVSSTGTSYYNATMSGRDRFGGMMYVTYRIREEWSYVTNSSNVYIDYILFSYYTSASYSYPQTTDGTGGDGSHNSWGNYSFVAIQVNSGEISYILYVPVGSTAYGLPFNGNSSCYLTYGGSMFSGGAFSAEHDSDGNASFTVYGYWSWGSSGSYPKDTRGGIHGGSSGYPASVTITLKDTKP